MSTDQDNNDVAEAEEVEAAAVEPADDELDTGELPTLELIEPDPLDLLQEQLDATTARLKAVSAAYQKLQGEFTHFKGRTERQMELKQEILKGDVVSRLFEPLSNLKRSIEAMERGDANPAWVEGMELVHKQFQGGFSDLGLVEIEAVGKVFDTRWHEALTTMPVTEESMDDVVVQVFSPGFRIGQRCIQPARVIVGAYTAPDPVEDAPDAEVIDIEPAGEA